MRKILLIIIITFLVPLLIPNVTKAEEMVTVRLKKDIGYASMLHLRLRGDYVTLDPDIKLKKGVNYKLTIQKGKLVLKGKGQAHTLGTSVILAPTEYDTNHLTFINGTPYLGAMAFVIENGQSIRPINQLPLEDYLKGVVPFEVFPSWNIEALKAQALAARTYAVSHMTSAMVDTIQDQVYGGYVWDKRTTAAVNDTKGEVITYHGHLIDAFYSASNGGMTENNAHVWGGKGKSFYPIKKDPYDPVHPWSFTFHQTQIPNKDPLKWDEMKEINQNIAAPIKTWLQNHGYSHDLKILSIPRFDINQKRNKADRALTGSITITFFQKLYGGLIRYEQVKMDNVPVNHIRPIFGGSLFKSYLVDSAYCNGQICTVKGKGFGHGVGMSQWGASIMGDKGKNYKEIIHFYFPGTKISNISDKKIIKKRTS